ncbi:MAG: hypothetical protein ACXVB9_14075 [Bdellovibrionota bacterium]
MKTFTLTLVLFTLALLPPARAAVLNVEEGTYQADGNLVSQGMLPDVSIHSVRKLENNTIHATTKAYLFGLNVATVSANLKVEQRDERNFDLLDLNAGSKLAGSGYCDFAGCTFTATVMDGKLRLTETWIRTTNGFDAVHCSQTFNDNDSIYEVSFQQTE